MPRNEPWATLVDDIEREGWRSQYVTLAAGGVALLKEGFGMLGSVVVLNAGAPAGFTLYDGVNTLGSVLLDQVDVPVAGSPIVVSTGELWARFSTGLCVTIASAGTTLLITYR